MNDTPFELSVVMPCLNEAETLGTCIEKAQRAIASISLNAEIIVADNGSTDGSIQIAESLGARIVHVSRKGYGAALMGGIQAAESEYVMMGDADDSYDWLEIPKFIAKLREGYDLVQGCRLPSGGGTVMAGAMPFTHRWIGNPILSFLVRTWFKTPIHDVYCGMRGFRKDHYLKLQQQCTGMEFATEMIIRSSLFPSRIAEVPTTLHPDGRVTQTPHLNTVRDGWRTLRFFLLYSPKWLFFIPGLLAMALGGVGYALALPSVTLGGIAFDAHTLLFASLFILVGYQAILFALCAKTFSVAEGLLPETTSYTTFYRFMNLERGAIAGLVSAGLGILLLLGAVQQWISADFGPLEYGHTMRWAIPGFTLTMLGAQTVLFSFFVSILGLKRK